MRIIVCFFVAACFLPTCNLRASVISTGAIRLFSTGQNGALEFDSNLANVNFNFQGGLALFAGKSVTSYGYGIPAGQETAAVVAFSSSAYIRASRGSLGVYVEGNGNGGWASSPRAGGQAFVQWSDSVTLFAEQQGELPPLPFTDLTFRFAIEGSLSASNGSELGSGPYSSADVRISFGSESLGYNVGEGLPFFGATDQTIFPTFDATASLQNGSASYSYSIGVSTQSTFGFGRADFGHTMTLESITFADGSTPESHGYRLEFGSGITSPNLSASTVPEASSWICLTGISLCFCAGGWWRNRKRAIVAS